LVRFFYKIVFMILFTPILFWAQEFSEAIEDNSFLIEEAYNQEDRVVQHIFNGTYFSKPKKDLNLSFTQEWPFFSYKHQLSYTIPFSSLNSNTVSGLGDVLINYRYQLFYKDDWACVAPRLSVILPTGNFNKGLGNDVIGIQLCMPASKRLSDYWVVHFNLGITFLPKVKGYNAAGNKVKQNLASYFTGGSAILLLTENFNIMLEYLLNNNSSINENGEVVFNTQNIVSPGFRYAINIGSLQIVPGIAVPISITRDETTAGMYFYLSFEHPF
jgi:hypothetical protein